MTFGSQTVTFIAVTEGTPDRLGVPAQVRTEHTVTGCRFRPLSAEETVALTNVATEVWKCTAPPVADVLAGKAVDELKVAGVTYQIIGGIKPFEDFTDPFKVTVLCHKQTG